MVIKKNISYFYSTNQTNIWFLSGKKCNKLMIMFMLSVFISTINVGKIKKTEIYFLQD